MCQADIQEDARSYCEGRSNTRSRGIVRGFVFRRGWPGGKSAGRDAQTATMQENVII